MFATLDRLLARELEGNAGRAAHNGPGGDQEVWHYHLHVFPRWEGDDLYELLCAQTTGIVARSTDRRADWNLGDERASPADDSPGELAVAWRVSPRSSVEPVSSVEPSSSVGPGGTPGGN